MIKKIFVCEFITGGGLCGKPLPKSLAKEGALMRDALLHDLGELPYKIATCFDQRVPLDARLDTSIYAACRPINKNEHAWHIWAELIKSCDAVLVVAPETDGILLKFAQLTQDLGKIWLGCSLDAIDVCGDKLKTYQFLHQNFLHQNNVPIPTFTLAELIAYDAKYPTILFSQNNQYVCKPRVGAGCEDTCVFSNAQALFKFLQNGRAESHIIQSFIQGESASLTMLCAHGKAHLLSCNAQKISIKNGEISYKGSAVNACKQHWAVFARVADFLAEKLIGLNGFIGVDVVFDEKLMCVIDINPRLTTSYVGLRQSIGVNPAKLMFDAHENKNFVLPTLKRKVVEIHV